MQIKVTNFCSAGCSHCMEDSTVAGEHMSYETFLKALALTRRVERLVREAGVPPMVVVSGGEPTEHPHIVYFIETAVREGFWPVICTNGLRLQDPAFREAILRPGWPVRVQVTYDNRYYPHPPEDIAFDDERIKLKTNVEALVPLGRAAGDVAIRRRSNRPREMSGPPSFNFRSFTHATKSIEEAVLMLRLRALVGFGGICKPAITPEGDVVAGETRFCFKIGTVDSTNAELTRGVLGMGSCNRCGLEDKLDPKHKRAIGLGTLYAPDE